MEEADAIRAISMSSRRVVDKLAWAFNRNGKFSVKSGNFLAKNGKSKMCMAPSSCGEAFGILKFPPRLKCLYGKPATLLFLLKTTFIEGSVASLLSVLFAAVMLNRWSIRFCFVL